MSLRRSGKLKGKTALITSGQDGIGRAVAVSYAREGANVAVVCSPDLKRQGEEIRRAVENEGVRCTLIPGDQRDPDFCEDAIGRTVKEFGRLDILVNGSGLPGAGQQPVTEQQWDQAFRGESMELLKMITAAMPHLKPGSVIINAQSMAGLTPDSRPVAFSAAEGTLHAFTKALAQTLAPKGIRVNGVACAPAWMRLGRQTDGEDIDPQPPYMRPAGPEEIAPAFVFFASGSDASHITGEVLLLLGSDGLK